MVFDDEIIEPGYRFYPTEEELISFYLWEKLQGRRQEDLESVIPVLYIYDFNPWDLPQLAGERCRKDPQLQEWFFFIPRQEREARGGRPNRLTTTGYWKATGSPGWVYSSTDNRIIGIKRTMVFYHGRARTRSGSKTDWKMNEYIAILDPTDIDFSSSSSASAPSHKGEFTVCRVYKRSTSLRAFDRRPVAPPPPTMAMAIPSTSSQPSIVDHHHHHPTLPDDHQNQPRSTVEKSSSDEGTSSSGDHYANTMMMINPSSQFDMVNEQEKNVDMEIDQAPLWDWDSLIWSF